MIGLGLGLSSRGHYAFGLAVLFLLAACPIPPDFAADAGQDAGATGSVTANLVTSVAGSTSLSWSGYDLSGTTIEAEGASGPSDITILASNASAGEIELTLGSLSPGSSSVSCSLIAYLTASAGDDWSCSPSSGTCSEAAVSISTYDGGFVIGEFSASFPQDSNSNSAQISGQFAVSW